MKASGLPQIALLTAKRRHVYPILSCPRCYEIAGAVREGEHAGDDEPSAVYRGIPVVAIQLLLTDDDRDASLFYIDGSHDLPADTARGSRVRNCRRSPRE